MKDPHLKFQPQSTFKFAVNAMWLNESANFFENWSQNDGLPMSLLKLKLEWYFSVCQELLVRNILSKNSLEAWYFVLNEIDTKLVITNLLLSDICCLFYRFISFFLLSIRFVFAHVSRCPENVCDYLCIRFVYCASHSSDKMFSVMFFFFFFFFHFSFLSSNM